MKKDSIPAKVRRWSDLGPLETLDLPSNHVLTIKNHQGEQIIKVKVNNLASPSDRKNYRNSIGCLPIGSPVSPLSQTER